jgi:hypothetical protein
MVAAEYAGAAVYTGGGLSGIFDTSISFANAEVIAGGGGSSGDTYRGGNAGDHDTSGQSGDGGYGNNGRGATHLAGGAAGNTGNSGYANPQAGSALNGGDAGNSGSLQAERYYGAGRGPSGGIHSGGGGSGYYGGGGGNKVQGGASGYGCGGGGGTGYLSSNVSNKVGEVGSGNDGAAPNTGDSDYVSPTAKGGEANSNKGGGGYLKIDGSGTGSNDMTLISNATTAEATPTKGDLVMTYTNGAGTASIGNGTNGDIRAFVSRDNGTNYTQFTLADVGDTGGHTILTAHDLDISGQPSGTTMRYKITTHNQSVSKQTRIQAVSLAWA